MTFSIASRAESDWIPHPETKSLLKDIALLRRLMYAEKVTPEAAILARSIYTQVESLWRQQR